LSVLWLCCCLISTSFCYNIVSRNGLNQLAGNGRRLQNSGCRKPVWISNIYYTASVKVQFSCSPIGQKRNTGRSKKRHVHYMLWWGGNRSTMIQWNQPCPQVVRRLFPTQEGRAWERGCNETIIDLSIVKPKVRCALFASTSKFKAKFFQEFQHVSPVGLNTVSELEELLRLWHLIAI
jgi:hypothetical protein